MYADKDKQREAVKVTTRRWRERKGITKVSQDKVESVIPISTKVVHTVHVEMTPRPLPDWQEQKNEMMKKFLGGK
jgi:hypothetical protein